MSSSDACIAFVNIGFKTTKLWVSKHDMIHSHISDTPHAVSVLKAQTMANNNAECLTEHLIHLWHRHQLDSVQKVVLLLDPNDHPLFSICCERIIRSLSATVVFSLEAFSVFMAVIHGTVASTLVLDVGHSATRLVPILDGMVISDCVRYVGGLGALIPPGSNFSSLFGSEQNGGGGEIGLFDRYMSCLGEALEYLQVQLAKQGAGTCLDYITIVFSAGICDSSFHQLLCQLIRGVLPNAVLVYT